MQRAHPALTQLWCQWTGIPGIGGASFDLSQTKRGPITLVGIPAGVDAKKTWGALSDFCGLAEDAPQRRQMPMTFASRDPAHEAFWTALKRRELTEVDGPLEWWWRLLIIRCGGIQRASRALIRTVVSSNPALDSALVCFDNPTLNPQAKTVQELIYKNKYSYPINMTLVFNKQKQDKHTSLAFSLSNDTFKARLVSGLIDLAVRVDP